MEIRAFGDSGRQRECERRLRLQNAESLYDKLVLLPIPTSRDGVRISGTDTPLDSLLKETGEGTLVAGYNIPEPFATALSSGGAHVYDAGLDERFLCDNADLTARGALGRILCEFERDICELSIAIIGYGRIGSRLLRYLLFLGGRATVFTGRESLCRSLISDGVDARHLGCGQELSDFDLIINTAPAPLIPESVCLGLSDGKKIMDLASGKFVPAYPGVIKLSSVPDAMYPMTAGGLYAKYISEYLFMKEGG
ncbi:MAG: hypothetical protein IJW03_04030 [Clostridia bacterium]|nr:hypothetical protein [Clostridia bacterium]